MVNSDFGKEKDTKLSMDEWLEESKRLVELTLIAYEVALVGLPSQFPYTFKFWFGSVTYSSTPEVVRTEREISDAFFLRLKSIIESQFKRLPSKPKPNWKSVDDLFNSLGANGIFLENEDRKAFGNFCVLRNCIAHNDGRVDENTTRKISNLSIDSDIWMTRETVRNWLELCMRVIEAIHEVRVKT